MVHDCNPCKWCGMEMTCFSDQEIVSHFDSALEARNFQLFEEAMDDLAHSLFHKMIKKGFNIGDSMDLSVEGIKGLWWYLVRTHNFESSRLGEVKGRIDNFVESGSLDNGLDGKWIVGFTNSLLNGFRIGRKKLGGLTHRRRELIERERKIFVPFDQPNGNQSENKCDVTLSEILADSRSLQDVQFEEQQSSDDRKEKIDRKLKELINRTSSDGLIKATLERIKAFHKTQSPGLCTCIYSAGIRLMPNGLNGLERTGRSGVNGIRIDVNGVVQGLRIETYLTDFCTCSPGLLLPVLRTRYPEIPPIIRQRNQLEEPFIRFIRCSDGDWNTISPEALNKRVARAVAVLNSSGLLMEALVDA